jgi:DNA-directed RNA polymerase subunit RPC12/RpoP
MLNNDILESENPAFHLYKKHVVDANYPCLICKNESGASFSGLEIDKKDLIHFTYRCHLCGSKSEKVFSLEEIRLMSKSYAHGGDIDFFECWVLPKYYKHLVNNNEQYKMFCEILAKPEKSRFAEALWRIFK